MFTHAWDTSTNKLWVIGYDAWNGGVQQFAEVTGIQGASPGSGSLDEYSFRYCFYITNSQGKMEIVYIDFRNMASPIVLIVAPDASLQLYTAYTGAVIDPYDGGMFTFAQHISTQQEHIIKIFPTIGAALYLGTVHNVTNAVQFSGALDPVRYRYAFLATIGQQWVISISTLNPTFSTKLVQVPNYITSLSGLAYNVDAGTLIVGGFDNNRMEEVLMLIDPNDYGLLLLDRLRGIGNVMYNSGGLIRPTNLYVLGQDHANVTLAPLRTSRM